PIGQKKRSSRTGVGGEVAQKKRPGIYPGLHETARGRNYIEALEAVVLRAVVLRAVVFLRLAAVFFAVFLAGAFFLAPTFFLAATFFFAPAFFLAPAFFFLAPTFF